MMTMIALLLAGTMTVDVEAYYISTATTTSVFTTAAHDNRNRRRRRRTTTTNHHHYLSGTTSTTQVRSMSSPSEPTNDMDGGDDGTSDDQSNETKNTKKKNPIEVELQKLQYQLELIEALEIRNESQLESFVDKQDQWDSLEEEERILLQSKPIIEQRMEKLTEELIQLWMGTKSMDG